MTYLISPKVIAEKLLLLRCRIEDWTHIHGWDNMDNHTVRKNKDGSIVWKQSDWEYVDDTHNHIVNDKTYKPYLATLKKMNKLWKKYS